MTEPRIDAVVVHYRSGGTIGQLADALGKQSGVRLRVIVIESGDDGSVAAFEGTSSWTVVDLGRNLGYCEGNNVGIKASDAEYVLIANPDAVPSDPSVLSTLSGYLERHRQVGVVAPLVRTAEGRIEYAESVVDLEHAAAFLSRTDLEAWPHGARQAVDLPWLAGAFWLFRREALEDVGLFDERFFLLCEEVDWCVRAAERGWQLALLGGVEVFHTRGRSFQRSQKAAYYYGRNMFLLCSKHARGKRWLLGWARIVLRPLVMPRLWRSSVPLNALWGAVDALRGRYGPRPLRP